MSIRLSKGEVSSYIGDVIPLKLIGEDNLRYKDIKWSTTGGVCHFREFSGAARGAFNDGILVTLDKVGEGSVTAEYEGVAYTAHVSVREARRYSDGKLHYYLGDMHDHMTNDHNPDTFPTRTENTIADYLGYLKEADDIDFSVISDHGDVVDAHCFFDGFVEAEGTPMNTVIFPGTESEITLVECDRYGVQRKNSGEIVVLNADNYSASLTYEEFNRDLATSPYALCTLAHPQVVGSGTPGIWRFKLDEYNHGDFLRHIKLVERGNGTERASNILNDFVYSLALDNGFRVSTTCSSDNHDAPWGKLGCPGKTVIMATERSKEAFRDAIENQRVYSTDSGNVKLCYTVNGITAPATVKATDRYSFHVEVGYFENDPTTTPYKLQLISDYGKVIYEVTDRDFTSYDFEVDAPTARWFYLRLVDREARKTFSHPTFTTLPIDPPAPKLEPIPKAGFTAHDLVTDTDASVLVNDNPYEIYESTATTADIVIDMKQARRVSALGHYTPILAQANDKKDRVILASFAAEYEILTSLDGSEYTSVCDGFVRTYGGEVLLHFPETTARYLRFKVKSTAGAVSEYPQFIDAKLTIAELTPFN